MKNLIFQAFNSLGELQYQGYVVEKVNDETMLIQLADAIAGERNVLKLVRINDMVRNDWNFFTNDENGEEWREFFYKSYRQNKNSGRTVKNISIRKVLEGKGNE